MRGLIQDLLVKWTKTLELDLKEEKEHLTEHRKALECFKLLYNKEKDKNKQLEESLSLLENKLGPSQPLSDSFVSEVLVALTKLQKKTVALHTAADSSFSSQKTLLRTLKEKNKHLNKENRFLARRIQNLPNRFYVVCRIRPIDQTFLRFGDSPIFAETAEKENAEKSARTTVSSVRIDNTNFFFDKVFTTEKEFRAIAAAFVDSFLVGGSVCVIAYGQTGSGKTHTISSLFALFAEGLEALGPEQQLRFCATEIYLEKSTVLTETELQQHNFSKQKLLALFHRTAAKRRKSLNVLNNESSRSHVIYRLSKNGATAVFVDLGGAEKRLFGQEDAKAYAETKSINSGLFALRKMVAEVRQGKKYLSYRNSVLTTILYKQLLERHVPKFFFVACIVDSFLCKDDSVRTLEFAQRVFKTDLESVKEESLDSSFTDIKQKIHSLKSQLGK